MMIMIMTGHPQDPDQEVEVGPEAVKREVVCRMKSKA